MPIYEYYCDNCQKKFEVIKGTEERESNPCPSCGRECKLMPSKFTHYWFNPLTVDGEGFTSKRMRHEELEEMNQEIRGR
jgi:putative FmdB family regulatory protein